MRIAVVGARFAGLDGVSLEAAKVAEALERAGHEISWFAGEIGEGFAPSVAFEPASFGYEANRKIASLSFGEGDAEVARRLILSIASEIIPVLVKFLDAHNVDAIVVQNAWAIPMQLPLAVAIEEVVAQRGIPTVAHHHDFEWERGQFSSCVVPEIIDTYFPPSGDAISHIVINTIAGEELARRRGLSSIVLPNVMDFESGDTSHDGGERLRSLAGLTEQDTVLLQPTRVIPRKGIEHTIELAARLEGDPKVIVTHPDDLDVAYWAQLTALARDLVVDLRLVDVGRDRRALASAYAGADLVCFPSIYEGYGNALIEAVFYRRPVLVNRYAVYKSDIAQLGFDFIEIDGEVTDEVVAVASATLQDSGLADSTGENNFAIGARELSYERVVSTFEESLLLAAQGQGGALHR